jgi:serine/threonine protein kinase/alpha-tubulin suppressor-like RCC1 family protein
MTSERVSGLTALEPSYEIIREIGRGGTSLVYLARERASDTKVAIKLIRAKYIEDEEAMGRFAREARFLERLVHPNIVRVRAVHELGDAGLAIVMAHVPGRTLKQLIQEDGRLEPDRAERFMRDIARALGAAHAMGIVHRDVKPENVFVDANDRPLLADFGLARSMSGDSQLTMAGVAIGTPAYMAPEQIEGASLDARGDVYSLGLVAWEMLTGHRPWEGESLYAVLYHQRYEQLPDVRDLRDDVPDSLGDAIAVAMEKNPASRWQSAEELIEALDGARPPRRVTQRPRMTSDTVRFARPVSPARPLAPVEEPTAESPPAVVPPRPQPSAPAPSVEFGPASLPPARGVREPAFLPSSVFSSLAAELEAQDDEPASPRRRRYAIAAGSAVALATIVLVAASVQGRSNENRRAPVVVPRDFAIGDTAKQAIPPTATVASSKPTPPPLPVSRTSPPPTRLPVTQQSSEPAKSSKQVEASPTSSTKSDGKPAESGASASKGSDATVAKRPDRATDREAPAPTPVVTAPPPIASSAPRVTVAAGGLHSCMLSADGRAFCWGGNDRGQLGAGGANSVATPLAVSGDVRFAAIATGLSHSCAVARGGAAWCWGENDRGQLGDRSTVAHQAPMRVADGHPFSTIGVGAAHSCALDVQGAAWCWGSNAHGQLGAENALNELSAPALVAGDHHFSSIAVGWNFTCAVDGGRGFCWGENSSGQLGDGSATERHTPVPIAGGVPFRSIATGNTHACGITVRGDAYCWGNNTSGQLGDGTRVTRGVPVAVKTPLRFAAIAVGALHTCALTLDGEAFCWGRDNYGQLGDGGGLQDATEPVRVAGEHSFASVRAFGSHTCATTTSGEAFCWGYNLDGQLGDGSRTNRSRPVYVEPPPGT